MQPLPAQPPRRDYMTIAQLAVSGLGLVFSLLAAFGLAAFGFIGLASASVNLANITALFSMAWISLLVAVLAVPSIVFSIQRLGGQPPALPRLNGFRLANMLIFVWPLVLLLGSIISYRGTLAWLLLPPLQILAVGLPVWWFFEIARRKLSPGSQKRGWGIVNLSIFITAPALMIIEIIVLLVLVVAFAIWLSTQPALMNLLNSLVQRLRSSNTPPDPNEILRIVGPYLQNPLVIFGGLGIVAVLIPIIEELFKPLAVWVLAGRRLTPAEGFAAGALCGATFALVESLFYLSNPVGGGWALLAVGRAGTELLHTTTAALLGWAIAFAWQNKAYLRLALTFLLAVFLHGLWNALNVLFGLAGALNNAPASLRPLSGLAKLAPIVIGIQVLLLFALLFGSNLYLQRQRGAQTDLRPVEQDAQPAAAQPAEPAKGPEITDYPKS